MSEHAFQSLTGGAVALSECDRNVYTYAYNLYSSGEAAS